MNEQLQVELSKFVLKINSGVDFMSDQIPDVLNQLLLWYGIKSFIGFSLFILFITLCCIISSKLHKYSHIWAVKEKKRREDLKLPFDSVPYTAMWVAPLILTTIVFFIGIMSRLTWLQVWLTPKAWIIDYITKMAR